MHSDEEDLRKSLLIAQYQRAAQDWTQFEQMTWQIPTIALTATSVTFAVAFSFIRNSLIGGLILVIGAIMDFTLVEALYRFRRLRDSRGVFLNELDERYHLRRLPFASKDLSSPSLQGGTILERIDKGLERYALKVQLFRTFYMLLIPLLLLALISLITGTYMIIKYFLFS